MNFTHASGHDSRQQLYMVENYLIHRATGREQHIKSVIHLLKNPLVVFLPHLILELASQL